VDKNKIDSWDWQKDLVSFTRRDFMKRVAVGGGGVVFLGKLGLLHLSSIRAEQAVTYRMIAVDLKKCTGCRTCETVCSACNHKVEVKGELLNGLGDPHLTNIRVHNFNPDVDVPAVCAMCPDNPCIEACPVEPHPETGRRALYRDEKTGAIKNDLKRCIACGNCAQACRTQRAGIIYPNPETNKPERMCTLCDGDPQCVKHCPYGALSYVELDLDNEFYGKSPRFIAEELTRRWYAAKGEEVGNE
jgi:Fe-S-cluster-containing hydrogenase component 2